MHPFFFGESGKQLLGLYHPAFGAERSQGVLICPPLGIEYLRTHRVLRGLAERLSAVGFHVLRFDYFATGDSAGEDGAGCVSQWVSDVFTAAAELKDTAGTRSLALVGLRMGATLAAHAVMDGLAAEQLVLWDPVLVGRSFVEQQVVLHERALVDDYRYRDPRQQRPGRHELLGFSFPPPLRGRISDLDLRKATWPESTRTTLITSASDDDAAQLAISAKCDHQVIDDVGDWADLRQLTEVALPRAIPRAIVDGMSGRQEGMP